MFRNMQPKYLNIVERAEIVSFRDDATTPSVYGIVEVPILWLFFSKRGITSAYQVTASPAGYRITI